MTTRRRRRIQPREYDYEHEEQRDIEAERREKWRERWFELGMLGVLTLASFAGQAVEAADLSTDELQKSGWFALMAAGVTAARMRFGK